MTQLQNEMWSFNWNPFGCMVSSLFYSFCCYFLGQKLAEAHELAFGNQDLAHDNFTKYKTIKYVKTEFISFLKNNMSEHIKTTEVLKSRLEIVEGFFFFL